MQQQRTLEPSQERRKASRPVAQLIPGIKRGPFTRIIEPQISGEALKPFVALAYFAAKPGEVPALKMHPHSGIATFTLMIDGAIAYEDSTGESGVLTSGCLEWLRAGAGAWHVENMTGTAPAEGFQLWLALPPEWEHAPPDSQFVSAEEVENDGPARVALGQYGAARSRVRAPESINYLHVRLRDGERWQYSPPSGHTVAWAFPTSGQLQNPETITAGELAIFEQSNKPLSFVAAGETDFLLGSAVKHRQELILGYSSVHSSVAALLRGKAEVERVGHKLIESGKIDESVLQRDLERMRPGNW